MPPERSVFYSADLIKRQYSIPENELKSNYDYTSIMPVYSIIFMEELANEDVAAVINDTNRGRIRKLEANQRT